MSVCPSCDCRKPLGFGIKMAFQPIVDISRKSVFAHEALVRGENGEGAGRILGQVTEDNKYTFDQTCRVKAIETASRIQLPGSLSINFMPNAIYEPETCLATTLSTARKTGFDRNKIIFEVTEQEQVVSQEFLVEVFEAYRKEGFRTAIDDFGAGYAGLNLLADFQPDILKIDMKLIRDINHNKVKQTLVRSIQQISEELGIQLIAEGIETEDEYKYLRDSGITLMQGYFFQKPMLEAFQDINFP
ncbi:EAL domain-containing protein [Idiomarina loihiensis]|uniref:EAL domain-containing protein n=2 Tax=Idiomarinaceae TaxID=267893 RepID=UPI00054FF34F|nr:MULTISPECIES: EAL domain-containing protein [Idiomarina]MBL4856300.1 EAL domain-containing protein [Idiomarina sp.]NWO01602.1 EAL domain-containing protein [Idiomarinaceae bacterium]MRJ45206.1 EAL domain-containing protein [Idiomarina loihiensis]PHQ90398.1 MAG: EAL domain-containing protein [Idiomarina sp.]PWW37645.1 EAL domain-containing protein (putative c-di-GMP-specific phosphodiesterase class I) [Idiomarina loihiensis]